MSSVGDSEGYKRVLKDAYHWMNQLDFPHGWDRRADCMPELSDALFLQNESDRKEVDKALKKLETTFADQRASDDDWLW